MAVVSNLVRHSLRMDKDVDPLRKARALQKCKILLHNSPTTIIEDYARRIMYLTEMCGSISFY